METPLDTQIGQIVQKFRERQALDDATTAQTCGLSLAEYRERERGGSRFSTMQLWALAQTFDISLTEMFNSLSQVRSSVD